VASLTASSDRAVAVDTVRDRLRDAIALKQQILDGPLLPQVVDLAELIVAAFRAGRKVIFLGNGGSAADAGHLAAELMGRFAYDRPGLPAICIADSTAAMTAIGNDYGYSEVFSRQVLGLGVAGDVVIGLTTSGSSPNVVAALRAAREAGMVTVVLTGRTGGPAAEEAEHALCVPSDITARVQEACLHLGHTVCELVERTMFPPAG
jgi:D-sedoheptulose 7-phosphate isomerase